MAGKVIAFANQKGGVGKTTTCVNMAASLVAAKKKVLLIDLDPQGNATTGSGVDKYDVELSINEVLLGECEISEAVIENTPAGYSLLSSNSDLTAAEVTLLRKKDQEQKLHQQLETIKSSYDFIVIDCPPSLNMLTLNALVASDSIIIPMQCEYYAMEGLSALLDTIEQIQSSLNPGLKIEGIIRTMFDPRNKLSKEVSNQLIKHFGKDVVYRAVIPRNVRLAEAPSYGIPVSLYDKNSRGAVSYMAMTSEFLKKQGSVVRVKSKKSKTLKKAALA